MCVFLGGGVLCPSPCLTSNNSFIPVKLEHTFLGLVFNCKLTFGPHIKDLRLKCQQSLNILRVLSHKSWRSNRAFLLRVYHSVIRSRLDNGSIVYGSTRASRLAILDPVNYYGPRLATGAFCTSPIVCSPRQTNGL